MDLCRNIDNPSWVFRRGQLDTAALVRQLSASVPTTEGGARPMADKLTPATAHGLDPCRTRHRLRGTVAVD
jgi:hypothetical protein